MDLISIAVGMLAFGGVFFTFVAVVGVLRLPDLYTRTHAVSKSDTLGAGFSLAAGALAAGTGATTLKLLALLAFLLLTNPTAAHALARSGRRSGVTAWQATDDTTPPDVGEET